ncbi:MAG: protein adenylyltransferase SelO family protein, partial [Aquabacterium sp.]
CADAPRPVIAMLEDVARCTARLMADWQAVGFCHGVMNTDNMSILGLTIDYGPYGFLDAFDPGHVCNHTDTEGRYASFRHPSIAFWNLHALAHALLPLVDGDQDAVLGALDTYKDEFASAMQQRMRAKLGLAAVQPDDVALADDLLKRMAADRVDFTIAWRRLCGWRSGPTDHPDRRAMRDLFMNREAFDAWASRYDTRLAAEGSQDAERGPRMRRTNPNVVLRNHMADVAIQRAQAGDFTEVDRLMKILSRPYDEQPEHSADAGFPPDWAQKLEVSCSS